MLWCLAAKIAFMYSAHTYVPRCCGLTCFIGWAGPASVTVTVLVSNLVHLLCAVGWVYLKAFWRWDVAFTPRVARN